MLSLFRLRIDMPFGHAATLSFVAFPNDSSPDRKYPLSTWLLSLAGLRILDTLYDPNILLQLRENSAGAFYAFSWASFCLS